MFWQDLWGNSDCYFVVKILSEQQSISAIIQHKSLPICHLALSHLKLAHQGLRHLGYAD